MTQPPERVVLVVDLARCGDGARRSLLDFADLIAEPISGADAWAVTKDRAGDAPRPVPSAVLADALFAAVRHGPTDRP
jgi:hypothetical protein